MKCKYIILSVLSILLTIPSYSQSLKELLEGESKYIAEPTKDATDTVLNTAVKTSLVESDLVFKAVAPALKIIKQQNRLKKDEDFFSKRKGA